MLRWEKKLYNRLTFDCKCFQDFQPLQRLEKIEVGKQANYRSHVSAYYLAMNVCKDKTMDC